MKMEEEKFILLHINEEKIHLIKSFSEEIDIPCFLVF